jgi:hypothetical protein
VSFLAPWALMLAAAAAVPLLLHLLRRRTGTRVDFPAVRYLLRAEKEHAREVRLRNLLLMLLRVGIVLAIALAVAAPIGPFPGVGHPPTAVALVVDNSLSSSAAGAEGPALNQLVAGARAVVDASSGGDELTLLTMDGAATSGSPDALRTSLSELRAIDGAGDAAATLRRARAVLAASALPERRLVILTDGQASAWQGPIADTAITTLAFQPAGAPPMNRAVTALALEPPHWSPRGAVRATLRGDSASWRLILDGTSAARGTAAPGAPIVARAQPAARGWIAGALELEPDELRGDDIRHFAVHVGEAPAVSADAAGGAFLRGAVDALVDGGRARRGTQVWIGAAERARRPGILFAPSDPLRVADANRALERAGIPWRLGARRSGAAPLRGAGVNGAQATAWHALTFAGDASTRTDTLVRVGNQPWAVAGDGYVLIASAADAEATDLPVRAAFLPWLDALLAERLSVAGGVALDASPGATVTVPSGVTALEAPDGSRRAVVGGETLTAPWAAGVHFWYRGDRRAGALVVNPEPEESDLTRLAPDSLARTLGADRALQDPARLGRETFAAGGRRALATPLLLLALVLLAAESLVARRGRRARPTD